MDMSIQEISAKDYHAMNVVTAYVLSRLAASQSMGIIGAGFKSPRHAVAMLAKRFPPVPDADVPLGSLPYITRQTVAYALSLVVSTVSYSRTCILTKGKAPLLYEKIYDELAKMTDDVFNEELLLLIRSYLFNTTAAEVQPTVAASATPGRAAAATPGRAAAATPGRAAAATPGGGGDAGEGAAPLVAADAAGGGAIDGEGRDDAGGGGGDDGEAGGDAGVAAAAANKGSDDAAGAESQTPTPKPSPKKGAKKGAKIPDTDADAATVKKGRRAGPAR